MVKYMKIKSKKNFYITLISLLIFLVTLFLLSYAYLKPRIGEKASTAVSITSCGHFTFLDGSSSINLTNSYPMSDNMGKKTTPFTFSIKNTCETSSKFIIYLVVPKTSEIPINYISYELQPTNTSGKLIDKVNTNLIPTLKSQLETIHSFEIENVIELTTDTLTPGMTKTYDIKLWANKSASNDVMNKTFEATVAVIDEENKYNFANIILNNYGGRKEIKLKPSPDFVYVSNTTKEMFAMEDDYGMSYYFRGIVDDNWVKFGKDKNDNDMYWRVVRINGNNSVKLVYSGIVAPTESEKVKMLGIKTQIGEEFFNSSWNLGEYVGYMYEQGKHRGHSSNSTVKTYIDTWYEENLQDYEEYLEDFVICTDRAFVGGYVPVGLPSSDQFSLTHRRVRTNFNPTLICPHKEDAYTVDDIEKGNGQLDYKIGMLTADEVLIAGAGTYGGTINNSFLNVNKGYWLLSPAIVGYSTASTFLLDSSGHISAYYVSNEIGVRPVISLNSDIIVSGTGLYNDPYIPILD